MFPVFKMIESNGVQNVIERSLAVVACSEFCLFLVIFPVSTS